MKKALFIVTLLMLFKPIIPIIEYVVNYEYISKVLCVNKEKLIMGCDGKCYLMSQLAKSSESEKPISDKKIVVKEFEISFFQEIKPVTLSPASFEEKAALNSDYSNLYAYLDSTASFHPPTFIS